MLFKALDTYNKRQKGMTTNYWRAPDFTRNAKHSLTTEQYKRFYKIFNEEFYLLDNFKNNDANPTHVFKICGSHRNVYTVTLHSNKIFWCDCPDMKNHAKKNQCVCKHIVFLLIRVLKLYDLEYFKKLVLDTEQYNSIQNKLDNLISHVDDMVVDNELVNKYKKSQNKDTLFNYDEKSLKDSNDECSICYDSLFNTADELLSCPTCKNAFHKRCMEKWLTNSPHGNCVYCRSSVWSLYITNTNTKSNYMQL